MRRDARRAERFDLGLAQTSPQPSPYLRRGRNMEESICHEIKCMKVCSICYGP